MSDMNDGANDMNDGTNAEMNNGMNNGMNDKIKLLLICLIFGTIGAISRLIDMPSSIICLGRAVLAVATIALILVVKGRKVDWKAVRRNLLVLIASGACMCVNWVSQFEAFRYTTIATATLCYYMEPIFFIIGAGLIYKEKISAKKAVCILVAFLGMVLVSGVTEVGLNFAELRGVLFAILGALFYATVVLLNKKLSGIDSLDSTMVQLAVTSLIMMPYCVMTGDVHKINFTAIGIIALVVLGVVHTGISYSIYFDTVRRLDAQSVGIISYIDPVEAVLLSAFLLHEPTTIFTWLGALMILGATAVSELHGNK